MAVKSHLIAIAIASALLGHWTPALVIMIFLSLGPHFDFPLSDPRNYLAQVVNQNCNAYLEWIPFLFGRSEFRNLFLSDLHLDEQLHLVSVPNDGLCNWIGASKRSEGAHSRAGRSDAVTHQPKGQRNPWPVKFRDASSSSLFLEDLRDAEACYEEFGAYTSSRDTKFYGVAYEIDPQSRLQGPILNIAIHDLGIMVGRLGMKWTIFKPEEGIVSAAGKDRVLYSTFNPIIGTLLHYTTVGDAAEAEALPSRKLELVKDVIQIPTREAAKLGFGILPGCKELDLPDYNIGSIEDVYATLNKIDPTCKASQKVRDVRGIENTSTFGFSDLIPMAAPMFRLRGSTIISVPIPTEDCMGLTSHTPGFVVFFHRLQQHIRENPGLEADERKWVESKFEYLAGEYSGWVDEVEANKQANGRSMGFLEDVHDCWDRTTIYFQVLQDQPEHPLRYVDLMAAHIKHAVNYWSDAWENIREGKARDRYGHRDWIAEGAHCYWDYLPSIATELKEKYGVDEEVVNEAWIMMMFRAMCWWRCHWMMEGQNMVKDELRLPTRYWGSQQTVYMG